VHIAVSTPLGTRVDSLVIAGDRERIRRETAHLAIRRALAAL
jgi:nicotinamide-nucleotide amidase